MELSLLKMPEIVLKTIIKKVDLRSILTLRKVCRDLRNFLNDTNLKLNFDRIVIRFHLDVAEIFIDSRTGFVYEKGNRGCVVRVGNYYRPKERLLEGSDYLEVFLNDLKTFLKNLKSGIKFLRIDFQYNDRSRKLFNYLTLKLSSWNYLVPVERLDLIAVEQTEVMSILPYLNGIKSLEISKYVWKIPFEIDQVVQLEQWRNLEEIKMVNLRIATPFSHFAHFKKVSICRESISGEDLVDLKEIFLNSPKMASFSMHAKHILSSQFTEKFGEPWKDDVEETDNWFFKDQNRILQFAQDGIEKFNIEWIPEDPRK